jgi:hypothetical protein
MNDKTPTGEEPSENHQSFIRKCAIRTHTGHNHVSVRNMEKSHTNVRNVEKPPVFHVFRKMIGLIVEREAMNVSNVG